MLFIGGLFVLPFHFGLNCFAAEVLPKQEDSKTYFEVGGTLGLPAGLNVNLGIWPIVSRFPFCVRVSGMYLPEMGSWVHAIGGAQLDLGWVFDREGALKQFLALSTSYYDTGGSNESSFGMGPTYNINLKGFSLQAGLGYALAGSTLQRKAARPRLHMFFQVGYTVLL